MPWENQKNPSLGVKQCKTARTIPRTNSQVNHPIAKARGLAISPD
jgi:hypothetical protein